MPYSVRFTIDAERDWRAVDGSVRRQLVKIFDRLGREPGKYGRALGGRLTGLCRLRLGDFRVVYQVVESQHAADIWVVAHRRNVYALALARFTR